MHNREPLALLSFASTVRIWCVTEPFSLGKSCPSDVHCGDHPSPCQGGFCPRLAVDLLPQHHHNLPAQLLGVVSQGSHEPLLKRPSAVASQSLSRSLQKKALSRRAPEGKESITESKSLLHCRLFDLRHPSSSSPCVGFTQQASSKNKGLLVSGAGFQRGTQCILQVPLRSVSPGPITGSSPQSPTFSRNPGQRLTQNKSPVHK